MAWPQRAGEFEILDVYIENGEIAFYLDDSGPPTTLTHSAPVRSAQRKANFSESNSVLILKEHWVYSEPFD